MLYDNAQLARLYLWGGIELGRPDFVEVARSTLGYLTRDLRHAEGGFFSSEDADSEGVEGKFYVWSLEEAREVLGDQSGPALAHLGITAQGNFEGANILTSAGDPNAFPTERAALLARRNGRVRPGLDDKVIAAWNGLAIRAFAEAGAALDDEILVDAARGAGEFVLEHLVVEGRLMRSWREGRTSVPGFIDDHAAMALGLFALFAATAEEKWYREAMSLVSELERFRRPEGGHYTTAEDGSQLVKRPFDLTDNPSPSGNALAAETHYQASLYTGDARLHDAVTDGLAAVGAIMGRYPTMVAHHLSVFDSTTKSKELAIVGPEWRELAKVHYRRFRPHVVLAPSKEGTSDVPLLVDRLSERGAVAFVCRGFVCDLPTSDPEMLAALLDG
jgi:uncharacterized protein YyaL (SSP411 family)